MLDYSTACRVSEVCCAFAEQNLPIGVAQSIVSLGGVFACTVEATSASYFYCLFMELQTAAEMG